MSASGDPGDGAPPKRARTTKPHRLQTMEWLVFTRNRLPRDQYREFVHTMLEIRRKSTDPDGEIRNISIENCKEVVLKTLDGQPQVIEAFQHFVTEGRSPFQDEAKRQEEAAEFLWRVKTCPDISANNFDALLKTLIAYNKNTITVENVFQKAKGLIGNSPQLLEEFKAYLPDNLQAPLPNEKSSRSPKISREYKTVPCFTPDVNNRLVGRRVKTTNGRKEVSHLKYTEDQNHDSRVYSLRPKQTKRIPAVIKYPRKEGNHEPPHMEDDGENKAGPLRQWSPSRENELPSKVDLSDCKHCTPSYCLLPKNCMTLQSSYQTKLGRSVFNDSLVSVTSGTEDCFKFRTKNQYEENMFKCEDDLFESDMLLQRFKATADFIEDLQDRLGSNLKIQDHLTPLHRRCIEQLYDDSGLDMLDALSESKNTSAALAVVLSRLNQKIEDFSEARLYLNKMCSDTIANNYYRSLDHLSHSFKQLDVKKMSPKALLAENKQTNKMKSRTDIHIHEDIGSIITYASSRSCTTEDKPMMNWTKLVKAYLSVKCQWPDLEDTVDARKKCERCGMSKDFLSSIHDALLTDEFVLSSKSVKNLREESNESTLHDRVDMEVEEGEFIPDLENIQLRAQCLVTNTSGRNCGRGNESEGQYESRDDSNREVGSAIYFGRAAKAHDVNGGISCCSLVVLCRLLQVMYERLLVAKQLSKEANAKFVLRNSCTRDSYAEFKEKLCSMIDGSTDAWNFEQHCFKFLGPKSYILFTLDKLIDRVITQICRIYPSREDSSILQQQEISRINLSKESHHQSARAPSIELLKQDQKEPKDSEHAGKVNHFQRRKKRMLENGAASFPQPN